MPVPFCIYPATTLRLDRDAISLSHKVMTTPRPLFLDHAGCMAAGTRDGWRAAQFYVRDLTRADFAPEPSASTWLSGFVASCARGVDGVMTWLADLAIRIVLPSWRKMPSPFGQGMIADVSQGVRDHTIVRNPLFNAYFFRAVKAIARHCFEGPHLVLEHRIDAARRMLAVRTGNPAHAEAAIAQIMIALVDQRPVARVGAIKSRFGLFSQVDPNIAICAIACMALLYAEEGKPAVDLDEEEFFMITSALMAPRLDAVCAAVKRNDVAELAQELRALRDLY
jgi:hypothetical protein